MIYVETSVLVALHTDERFTSTVSHWYANLRDTVLATADWTIAEFASALEHKKRTREIATAEARRIWRYFQEQCAEDMRLLPIGRDFYLDAAALLQESTCGLRAGHALHLAVALQSGAASMATLDVVLQKSAAAKQLSLVPFADPFLKAGKVAKARTRP